MKIISGRAVLVALWVLATTSVFASPVARRHPSMHRRHPKYPINRRQSAVSDIDVLQFALTVSIFSQRSVRTAC